MRNRWRFGEGKFPHFMTCSVVGFLPAFTRPDLVQIVFDSWEYLQTKRNVVILGYVVMENHLHWVARSDDLTRDAGDFKSFTARRCIDWLLAHHESSLLDQLRHYKEPGRADREYQFWQQGSHPKEISTEEMLVQKLEYIHANPVRRGYITDPIQWRYSSARNYAKLSALAEITTDLALTPRLPLRGERVSRRSAASR